MQSFPRTIFIGTAKGGGLNEERSGVLRIDLKKKTKRNGASRNGKRQLANLKWCVQGVHTDSYPVTAGSGSSPLVFSHS